MVEFTDNISPDTEEKFKRNTDILFNDAGEFLYIVLSHIDYDDQEDRVLAVTKNKEIADNIQLKLTKFSAIHRILTRSSGEAREQAIAALRDLLHEACPLAATLTMSELYLNKFRVKKIKVEGV
jgi:hypothetical protein